VNLREALDIVLSLAQDNALDINDCEDDCLPEAMKQDLALEKLHKLLDTLSDE
jgi:hypothetical protein